MVRVGGSRRLTIRTADVRTWGAAGQECRCISLPSSHAYPGVRLRFNRIPVPARPASPFGVRRASFGQTRYLAVHMAHIVGCPLSSGDLIDDQGGLVRGASGGDGTSCGAGVAEGIS